MSEVLELETIPSTYSHGLLRISSSVAQDKYLDRPIHLGVLLSGKNFRHATPVFPCSKLLQTNQEK